MVIGVTTTATQRSTATSSVGERTLRVLAAAGLATSAYVHIHLAHRYAGLGNTITMEQLFYAQGIVAALVTLWLLATGNRWAWRAAGLIGVASFAAVMVYRYVSVGAIGPLPDMSDPTWSPSPEKALSAVVEAAVFVLWLGNEALRRRRR